MSRTIHRHKNTDINICVLGSSSSGNCTVIWDTTHIFLIDCGLPLNRTKKELYKLGLNMIDITVCFITHSHSDHVNNALFNEFNKNLTPVVCCKSTLLELLYKYPGLQKCNDNNLTEEFIIEKGIINKIHEINFIFQPFIVQHDCPGGCFGYKISHNFSNKIITVATDFGLPQPKVLENFYNSDVVIIESNYDEEMLNNSGRDKELIDRIRRAHINNTTAGDILVNIYENSKNKKPQYAVLTHLSPECNQHRKTLTTIKDILFNKLITNIKLTTAYKEYANRTITF